jgi:hypothetical protein
MDSGIPEKLRALAPQPEEPLSDADWHKLRIHMQSMAKQDSLKSAFTLEYNGYVLPLDYVMGIYELGRKRKLPREWVEPLHQIRVMQTQEYEEHKLACKMFRMTSDVFNVYEQPSKTQTLLPTLITRPPGHQPTQAGKKIKIVAHKKL